MYFILLLFFSGIVLAARPWFYAPDTEPMLDTQ
jgi:hypothetical protein